MITTVWTSQNSKWVWLGNTTITNHRQSRGIIFQDDCKTLKGHKVTRNKHKTISESHNGRNTQQRINNNIATALEWRATKATGGLNVFYLHGSWFILNSLIAGYGIVKPPWAKPPPPRSFRVFAIFTVYLSAKTPCVWSLFSSAILAVLSSFAIISLRKKRAFALVCGLTVVWL